MNLAAVAPVPTRAPATLRGMGTMRGAADREKRQSGDGSTNCDAEDPELLEFLAGELEPETASSDFKQRLGRTLWTLYRIERMLRVHRD